MARKGDQFPIDPAIRAKALSAYQGGESLSSVSERLHLAQPTLKRILSEAGVPVRARSEQNRLEALRQHSSPLRQISAERWREMYWSGDFPSVATLRERLTELCGHKPSQKHVIEAMREAGISTRTPAEQLALDGKFGRRDAYIPPPFESLPPETQESIRQKVRGHKIGLKQSRTHRRNNGLAHRKRETRLCAWCGSPITRIPARFRQYPESFCNRSCTNKLRHWRRRHGQDAARPLLLDALIKAMGPRPRTLENAERFAARVGAGDLEIFEVLLGHLDG